MASVRVHLRDSHETKQQYAQGVDARLRGDVAEDLREDALVCLLVFHDLDETPAHSVFVTSRLKVGLAKCCQSCLVKGNLEVLEGECKVQDREII